MIKNTKSTQNLVPIRISMMVNKAWLVCLNKVQESKLNKNTWFQTWTMFMQRRVHKETRHFGLDAVPANQLDNRTCFQGWMLGTSRARLSKVQGSKEKRARRISNTVSELRTQLTQQFAKSIGRVWGSATKPTNAARGAGGFTIVELLIATAVFSIVLMTALAGFLQIGRLFYQGVSSTQTQTVVNQLFQDIVGNFQTAANISPPQNTNGYTYYCIGSSRYTYNIGKKVNLADVPKHAPLGSGGNFGLLKDILPGATACATPCDDLAAGACSPGAVAFKNPVEILGDNMRLGSFDLQQNLGVSPNFYTVSVVVAYGDDELLDYTAEGDHSSVFCKGGSSNQQFCAVSRLATGVYKEQGQ